MTVRPRSLPEFVRDDVVATVGGRGITIERVDERLADLRRGPRARHIPPEGAGGSGTVRRWVVQELVTEAVLSHEARAVGIADVAAPGRLSPTDVARLVARVTADVTVPVADARAYYERNLDLYHRPEARRVRLVLLGDEVVARDVAARAAAGDAAGVWGQGYDLRRGELAGPLEDAIFGANAGAVVGPIRSENGWHVARIEAVIAATVAPFAEVRAAVEEDLLVAARARAFDEWLDGRRRALVVMEPGFEHPGHPVHGIPSHRH